MSKKRRVEDYMVDGKLDPVAAAKGFGEHCTQNPGVPKKPKLQDKPMIPTQDKPTLSLQDILSVQFANRGEREIPWLDRSVFDECMRHATNLMFQPPQIHHIMIVSPCAYTRQMMTYNFVDCFQRELGSLHAKINFRYSVHCADDVDEIGNDKDAERFALKWCKQQAQPRELPTLELSKPCIAHPILICDVQDTHTYEAQQLINRLSLLLHALRTHRVKEARVIILLSGEFEGESIRKLSQQFNASTTGGTRSTSEDPIDKWNMFEANKILRGTSMRNLCFGDIWAFPPPRAETIPFVYSTIIRYVIAHPLSAFNANMETRIPLESCLVLSRTSPHVADFAQSLQIVCNNTQRIAEELNHEGIDINLFSVVLVDNDTIHFKLNDQVAYVYQLSEKWEWNRNIVTSTMAKIHQFCDKMQLHVDEDTSRAVGTNIGIMAGAAGYASEIPELVMKNVRESQLNLEKSAVVAYDETTAVLSFGQTQFPSGRNALMIMAAYAQRIMKLERDQAEMQRDQVEMQNRQALLEARVDRLTELQPAVKRRNRTSHGGIYLRNRSGQMVGYWIKYKLNGKWMTTHVGKTCERRGGFVETDAAELRFRAKSFGLEDFIIDKSLSRLNLI